MKDLTAKRKRFLVVFLFIASFLVVAVCAVFLIGLFYGSPYYRKWSLLYAEPYYELPTIYRIGEDLYVPVSVGENTQQVIDDIPYYYGRLSDDAYQMVFAGEPERGSGLGTVDGSFLKEWYVDTNEQTHCYQPEELGVYTVCSDGYEYGDDFRLVTKYQEDQLVARISRCYSKNMRENWYEYARELDILFEVERRKSDSSEISNAMAQIKSSPYYTVQWGDFWHEFKMRLAFFASDVSDFFCG